MNWFTLLVLLILIFSVINGYRKGFVRLVISLLSLIFTIFIVAVITPYIGDAIKTQTGVYNIVQEKCVKALQSTGQENKKIDQDTVLESSKLPDVVKNALAGGNAEDLLDGLGAYEYVGDLVANIVIYTISFFVSFIVITIIFRVTILSLDFITKIPVINGINKLAGILVGAAQGVITIWFGFIIIFLMSGTGVGKMLIAQINASIFLDFFYNNNLILQLITSFLK
ncbi:CvpA family protein [Anaerosacchariphilus polymeriproducens]|uniref:CvpA family protein n=1 Tax=Anaerosacchariphilus polymeriproducens TaxID=1812858 RepID=A0A371AVD8_9FIRM|nr:CvpA family protein [Anaerosacchariphilus polymeriproducens]RDU23502.1 CvpA family protein [Anaerosacchariphilus polymeriproducens]